MGSCVGLPDPGHGALGSGASDSEPGVRGRGVVTPWVGCDGGAGWEMLLGSSHMPQSRASWRASVGEQHAVWPQARLAGSCRGQRARWEPGGLGSAGSWETADALTSTEGRTAALGGAGWGPADFLASLPLSPGQRGGGRGGQRLAPR